MTPDDEQRVEPETDSSHNTAKKEEDVSKIIIRFIIVIIVLIVLFMGRDFVVSSIEGFVLGLKSGFNAQIIIPAVKNGKLSSCPNKSVGEMVSDFIGNPKWSVFSVNDSISYVNVSGSVTYKDSPADIVLQFVVKSSGTYFAVNSLNINGENSNILVTSALLEKMCK